MSEKVKINAGEFQLLVIMFFIGSSILLLPGTLAATTMQDAWISSALTLLINFLLIFLFIQLAKLYPAMTYVQCNEKVLGKWLGKISAFLFLFYFFETASALTREIGDFFNTHILIGTPIKVITFLFLATSLIGARLGLEVICRTAVIFFPWVAVLLFILYIFLIPDTKMENIQPILGEGVKPVLKGMFSYSGYSVQLIVFLMITRNVSEYAKIKKAFYGGTFIGGLFLFLIVLFSILVLGADTTSRQSYPSYTLGKQINIGGFLERIEVIVAIIWVLTIYFKLTLCYYVLSLGLSQVFQLEKSQILQFPLFFLIWTFSIFGYPDIVYFNEYSAKAWVTFSLTIGLFQPLLLLVVGKIRGRYANSTNK